MAQQIINIGSAPNDGTGDQLRTSFDKCNQNFTELYTTGGGSGASITISDTPPGAPTAGSMWWESDTGRLWIYFNDGTSSQWVVAAGGTAQPSIGRTDGSAPGSGQVGERISAGPFTASGMGLNTIYNLGTLAIPAGDWEVWGQAQYVNSTAGGFGYLGLSMVSAAFNYGWLTSGYSGPSGDFYASVRPGLVSVTATANVYLIGYFSSAFDFNNAYIIGRRMS
jgi:hypothetical protein